MDTLSCNEERGDLWNMGEVKEEEADDKLESHFQISGQSVFWAELLGRSISSTTPP